MLEGSQGKKIGIIGGSIAGLAIGICLRQRGYDVTIFERSTYPLKGRGAGIAMPGALVQKCIELNLFDSNIERLQISYRSFLIKDPDLPSDTRSILEQPLFLTPFNWTHIYSNLLKRFPEEYYLIGQNVNSVRQDKEGCYIETNHSTVHHFDRIIAADGINSIVRKTLFPETSLQYANYIAWRGLLDDPSIVDNDFFNLHCPFYMFSNGHLVIYKIPAADYEKTGRMLLNWVLYEYNNDKVSLVDKNGSNRRTSIPPGMLENTHINHLHSLAYKVLPSSIAKIVCQTKEPFIQAIFDYQAPNYMVDKICLLGDAGHTKRPHTASGLVSALEEAITLAEAMDPSIPDIEDSLKQWNDRQLIEAEKQNFLAKTLGRAMVTDPPNWLTMDKESTLIWWNNLMLGKNWYAIDKTSTETATFERKKQFTPKNDLKLEKLSASLAKIHLSDESTPPAKNPWVCKL